MIESITTSDKVWVYDIELYSNFWSVTFVNTLSGEVKQFYELEEDVNQESGGSDVILELTEFIKTVDVIVGYNSHAYDNILLQAILAQVNKTKFDALKGVSNVLINSKVRGDNLKNELYTELIRLRDDTDLVEQRTNITKFIIQLFKPICRSVDLKELYDLDVSLKHCGIILNHNLLQELPIPFDARIEREQVSIILKYNENDCIVTKKVWLFAKEDILLREALNKEYSLTKADGGWSPTDLISKSKAQITVTVLKTLYQREKPVVYGKKLDSLQLGDCIVNNIKFQSKEFNDLLLEIKNTKITGLVNKYSKKNPNGVKIDVSFNVNYDGNQFSMGLGGLHSIDRPLTVTDADGTIWDTDVTSYYPSLMLVYNKMPSHLDQTLCHKIFKGLVDKRIQAKFDSEDMLLLDSIRYEAKYVAAALKIVINTFFGKTLEATSFLYDPLIGYGVTISGQLLLLMLCEKFALNGIKLISANTDGLICFVPTGKEETYISCIKEWEAETALNMEQEQYKTYMRRDINNYIAVKMNGGLKTKGCYATYKDLNRKCVPSIIKTSIYEYIKRGIPIEDTITNCTDIYSFCSEEKTNKEYTFSSPTEVYGKICRFVFSYRGTLLFKTKKSTGVQSKVAQGRLVKQLFNIDDTKPIDYYNLDYNKYIIDARQALSDLSSGKGTIHIELDKSSLFYGL